MASEETLSAAPAQPESATSEAAPPELSAAPEKLDEIEEIDFLLEEIESKIAPLALA